jgi:hypothetical protein
MAIHRDGLEAAVGREVDAIAVVTREVDAAATLRRSDQRACAARGLQRISSVFGGLTPPISRGP